MASAETTKKAGWGAGALGRLLSRPAGRRGPTTEKPLPRRGAPALGAIVFYVAWAINPALFGGCTALQSFEFSEADMVRLLDVANRTDPYRFTSKDGQVFEVSLELRQVRGEDKLSAGPDAQPSLVKPAHACGDRTFYRSASACKDITTLPVEGTVTVKGPAPNAALILDHVPATGSLKVYGPKLTGGGLSLGARGHGFHLYSDDAKTFALERAWLVGVGEGGKTIEQVER